MAYFCGVRNEERSHVVVRDGREYSKRDRLDSLDERGKINYALTSAVPSHSPTTEELLKRAEDLMREDCAYLKDFNAAVDALQKRQAEFHTEHPAFGRHS